MSIITSFVNVIAGASVLLGGESFMNKKIGGSDVPLRNAIGVPLLGVGTLGILVSYIRNRRVREDKKAESDFYEAELYDAEETKYVRGITVGQRPKMKRGWSITSHGTGHHEQRYATKDGITVLIQPIPANSYWGRQKNARYRLTYNRDVPDADSLVPQAKFFRTYEAIFDWLDNPPFEIQSFDAEEYGAETFESPYAGAGSLMDIGKDTGLGNFTNDELTKSSAIHGDFDHASLNYSGHQNLQAKAENFEAIMSTDKTFTGETASGHKVEWDDGSFTMTFAEPIDGYTDVSGYWYGGDDRTPSSFTLDVQNDDYDSIDLYIDGVEAYGVSTNHMGVNEDELSLQVREAVKEGLDWMLGDYEEKTVVERQYRAEHFDAEFTFNGKPRKWKRITDIDWGVDKRHVDYYQLPDSLKVPQHYDNDEIFDYLHDEYGFMVMSFFSGSEAVTFDAEATPYGESDSEYPVRIIVGGPPHSGKSTLMNLLEDKMKQYGIPVELRDLDFSSPTNLKAGFDPNRKTKDWTEELARDAANYFREDSQDQIVLGDSIGLISVINEIVSEPADVAILLVSGSKDQYDESFRNALAKWESYYDFIDLPILMVIRSSMNPNEMNYFDPHDNYGVIVGLDRDAYKDGGIDNEISLENACLEGMVFEIAQEYDLELANRNTDEHIATISEKWPNIEGKPTWNPIDAGKPHLGKIEDDYFSTFDERRKAKAMSAENDPDFDREKADRNKDGVISDWEQSVGNAVAKGIREHAQKKSKSSSMNKIKVGEKRQRIVPLDEVKNMSDEEANEEGITLSYDFNKGMVATRDDMHHYMNMRWTQYTPRQKRDMELMDLYHGHSNKSTKRHFKKGYEYGWNLAREKTANGEPLYMVARAKDLINSSIRKNGIFYDSGAWAGFNDSWQTYEGKEPR